jgi:glucose/arabinose dehydrogenase
VAGGVVLVASGAATAYAWQRGWLDRSYLAAVRPCGDLVASTEVVASAHPAASTVTTAAHAELSAVATHPLLDVTFVGTQDGRVFTVDAGGLRRPAVLDLRDEVTAEQPGAQGLLSLAVAPDGAHLYAWFTSVDGPSRLRAFALGADGGPERSSPALVLEVEPDATDHNGGTITFGPDSLLYLSIGDGGLIGDEHANAQDLGTLLGKILRIEPRPGHDPAYRVPDDNPFVDRDGARPEIFAYGMRNPFRMSFDAATGDLWVADVGNNCVEEITRIAAGTAGANLGWNRVEGTRHFVGGPPPDHVAPVFEYAHAGSRCSVTGGVVVPETGPAELVGRYVFADFCEGRLLALEMRDGEVAAATDLDVAIPQPVAFVTDRSGALYVLSYETGLVRLDAP